MRRLGAALGLAVLFTIPPLWGFTRFNGPTSFAATRAAPTEPFEVQITLRRGPFTSVDAFTSKAYPNYVFRQPDAARKERPEGFADLYIEESGVRHPITSLTFAEPGRPQDLTYPLTQYGERYIDSLENGALNFSWEFPGERPWTIFLTLSIAAPLLGAIAGFLLSGRRGT